MLLKNIKRLNIFSIKFQKRHFPRDIKSNVNKITNKINIDNKENGNLEKQKNEDLSESEKEFENLKSNFKKKNIKKLNLKKTQKDSDSEGDLNFNDLPEIQNVNLKKITKSKEEKNDIELQNKFSKMIDKISDPSDEDAIFTGEEGKEINYDDYFDTYFLARVNDKLPHVPPDIQEMAKKVFSKHSFKDIKFWTEKFLLNYSQNHACEPPIDLSNLPKDSPRFANSEELNIKVKLFNQLDTLNDFRKNQGKKQNNDEDETKEEFDPKSQVKLDKYHTIDIEDERKLNKDKENKNPIKVEYTQAQAVAYLYCRMPYTYQVCRRILTEILFRMPNFKPKSILDFGAGLGSAVWAAHHIYKDMIVKYAAVEPNRDMRRLGKFLTSTIESEILWVESITMIPGAGIERGKFDIIFLSHVLQEVSTAKMRQMILDTLWNRLSNDGIVIVIEPGSPKGFRFITDVRKWVIDKPRDDANIVSPCPHHMECPLANRSETWCHFSQLSYKYNKDIITKQQKEKQIFNEKFTYLVIKKGKTPSANYKTEYDAKTIEEKSFFWERIIRPVMRKHQHRIVDLCTKRGKFERRIISKSHGGAGGYKSIKRFNWGDLWYVPLWIPNKFRKERLRGKRLW